MKEEQKTKQLTVRELSEMLRSLPDECQDRIVLIPALSLTGHPLQGVIVKYTEEYPHGTRSATSVILEPYQSSD